MTKLSYYKMISATFLLCAVTALTAQAQTLQTLFTFDGTNGSYPNSLVQGPDGNLYGTTAGGGGVEACNGVSGCGTIFRISPDGKFTTVYTFCEQTGCPDGEQPVGGLTLGQDGNLYGVTAFGGGRVCQEFSSCGTIFRITLGGKLTTLYLFCTQTECPDGGIPEGGLVLGADGNFYGTTSQLGPQNGGSIFRMTPAGRVTVLYQFCSQTNCVDGAGPAASLIQASDGFFYGTTGEGGRGNRKGCPDSRDGCGTIFRLTPSGKVTTIYNFCSKSFCTDGALPVTRLVQGTNGSLFGTTQFGGDLSCGRPYGCGTVFSLDAQGALTTLDISEANTGIYPGPGGGLVQATDGYLYGETEYWGPDGYGTLFQMSSGGAINTIEDFGNTQGEPGALVQATSGIFYGTTGVGDSPVPGTIFSLNMNLGPFVTFVVPAGKVGSTGGILGQGFKGTTSVELNGVPANFTVVSDNYLTATIPQGATTGYVTVTTPSGVLTSNVPFRVIQ